MTRIPSPDFRFEKSAIPTDKPDVPTSDQVREKGPADAEESGAVGRRMSRLPGPNCVVKVGAGRGFIIEHRVKVLKFKLPRVAGLRRRKFRERRLIVTAAHCLPEVPPAHRASYPSERTIAKLVSTLEGIKHDIWVECLFVDPVADVAVLGCPDDQELSDEADAYNALTADALVARIGKARSGPGWVLSLSGQWVRTKVKVLSGLWGASLTIDLAEAGMSGSPILNDAGRAIGLVAIGSVRPRASGGRKAERASGQPILMRCLPGWLLQDR